MSILAGAIPETRSKEEMTMLFEASHLERWTLVVGGDADRLIW